MAYSSEDIFVGESNTFVSSDDPSPPAPKSFTLTTPIALPRADLLGSPAVPGDSFLPLRRERVASDDRRLEAVP